MSRSDSEKTFERFNEILLEKSSSIARSVCKSLKTKLFDNPRISSSATSSAGSESRPTGFGIDWLKNNVANVADVSACMLGTAKEVEAVPLGQPQLMSTQASMTSVAPRIDFLNAKEVVYCDGSGSTDDDDNDDDDDDDGERDRNLHRLGIIADSLTPIC